MSGFIDPEAPLRRRVDRLDRLIDVMLPLLDRSALSPEARAELERIDREFGPVPQEELDRVRRDAEAQVAKFFDSLPPAVSS